MSSTIKLLTCNYFLHCFIPNWIGISFALNTNFKITSGGETIFLSDVSGNVIDTMHVPEMDQDISYGYYNDGGGALSLFNDPTPGESNSGAEAFTDTHQIRSSPVQVDLKMSFSIYL